jgi:RNA polymerase sigma factor (sigma-70 family)
MDTAELLRRYVEDRSQEAFTELVRGNLDLVYSAALRQLDGDSHRAQEAAQVVFTDLARKAPSLSRHTALTGWLYTSTHFAAAKLRRTEQRRQALEREASVMNELTATAESAANWEKLRPVLDGVMHELNARDREAVLLRYFEQRSFAEVGDHLGLGENAARMTVERALDKLSGLLARRGVNSTAAALALALTGELGAAAPAGLVTTISTGALAAAASTAGFGVAAILKIMSTIKFASIAAVVAIAAVGTALYEAQSARTSAAALVIMTRERDSLRAQLAVSASAKQTAAPPQNANSQLAAAAERVTAPRATTTSTTTATPASKSDPARLAQYHQRFDAFVKQRGLTPEQADKLFEILGDWDDARRDFQASIREQGLTATPEAQKSRNRLQQQFEVEPLIALLGRDGERAYFDFEGDSFYRAMVEPFAQNLAIIDLPLTADQTAKLVALVKSNMHTVKRDPTAMGSEAVIDWQSVLATAARFLDPKQMTVMQAQVARQYPGK